MSQGTDSSVSDPASLSSAETPAVSVLEPPDNGSMGRGREHRKMDCIICYSNYNLSNRLPRRLYCGHTFCQACIRRLDVIVNEQHWIPCPQCRQNTPSPRGGVTMLDLDLTAFLAIKAEKENPRLSSDSTGDPQSKLLSKDQAVTQQPTERCQISPREQMFPSRHCCKNCFACCCV
ncbi:RING finger protein 224-like [Protopterus annectens]|uniref:RING finger protein 224-like n=1 Tax=Protopterus annectens TaxID=7888 RepID=UPI001CFB92CF|nr:RING finger protein 224-like [Protopterus annectens]